MVAAHFTLQWRVVTLIALLVLLQTPPPTSPPPLVPLETPPVVSVMSRPDAPVSPVKPPIENAFHFSPGSVFALFASVEYERRLLTQLTMFGAFGGGPFGQLGFDVGLRLYPVERAFESFFVDARFSGFGMTSGLLMLGPMVELGYSWRVRNSFLLSVGGGAAMWLGVVRSPGGRSGIFNATVIDAAVFSLPGFFQPPRGQVGLQPTIRLTIGPGF